jgi:hypothetical protein
VSKDDAEVLKHLETTLKRTVFGQDKAIESVLSPAGNPGFLPGMNAGAFNLGAGLSFLILPAVLVATSALGDAGASYLTVVLVGLGLTVAAFAASLLIPKPVEAEVAQ